MDLNEPQLHTLVYLVLYLNPKLVAPEKLIKVATSMCDVSDGLATDAAHLSYASNVNFNLSKDLISQAADFKDLAELAKELNEDVFDWILTGGEDHFFLATVDKENESNELGIQIGSVGKGEGKLLLDGDRGILGDLVLESNA